MNAGRPTLARALTRSTARRSRPLDIIRLALIGGLASFGPLSLDLYLPALPRIARALNASDGLTQLSVSGCLIGLAIGQLVAGPLSDRCGRRGPLLAGVSLWTASALACALAPSAELLVVLRVLQGLGGAAGLALSRAVVRDLYDSEALARAFAVVALLSNITPAVAPVVGGALLQVMSWRGLFLVLTGIGALLLVGVAIFLPESLPVGRRRAGGLRDVARTARVLVDDPVFRGTSAALALASAMLFTYISLSSFVLQHDYGLTAGAFALVFAANSVGIILTATATVRLLRRFAPRRLLSCALLAAVLSTVLLCVVVLAGMPVGVVLACLFCAVATIGMTIPTATTLALLHQADSAGTGSALLGGAQYAVGGLAAPVISLIAAETGAALALAMGIFAAAALLSSRTVREPRRPREA